LYETNFALLVVRVNGLKHINNSLGIFTGDTMLKEAGLLIKNAVASSIEGLDPFIGRLSGGDFAVLLTLQELVMSDNTRLNAEKAVKACCDAIIEKTKDSIDINGYKVYPSFNIGASIYPYHGATAEELLGKAELAKGSAKQNSPNSYKIYDNLMDGDVERVMFLNNNLPIAMSSNQFELFYQAQMEMKTGLIVGAEALIRWRHPKRGLIFPGYFISYVEDNGYGIQLDILVLEMACEQINAWRDKGFDLSVSVNISAKHFINGLIYDTVGKVLESKGIKPSMLKIELLESTVLENFDVTVKVIDDLRKMGVTVALDDFGAGYSSLEYVAKLPLDYLKIDRTFSMHLNENPSNKIILKTIMTLAKGMKVKTIVEGVEDQSQFDFLKKVGSDLAQGYFINKPMPVNEFEQLLEQNRQGR
jgi:EAL domain-containing protein (putative c-di-GMP-specific phosphodiesterase class I)/GGDEF domain-containing protein